MVCNRHLHQFTVAKSHQRQVFAVNPVEGLQSRFLRIRHLTITNTFITNLRLNSQGLGAGGTVYHRPSFGELESARQFACGQ